MIQLYGFKMCYQGSSHCYPSIFWFLILNLPFIFSWICFAFSHGWIAHKARYSPKTVRCSLRIREGFDFFQEGSLALIFSVVYVVALHYLTKSWPLFHWTVKCFFYGFFCAWLRDLGIIQCSGSQTIAVWVENLSCTLGSVNMPSLKIWFCCVGN